MKRISSIPPKTSIGVGLRGQGFNRRTGSGMGAGNSQEEFKVHSYGGKNVKRKQPPKLKVSGASEAILDAFEESENALKIVGEFPGIIDSVEGLVIDMEGNKLSITNRLNSIKQYHSVVDLPEDFAGATIRHCESKNGIITVLLERRPS